MLLGEKSTASSPRVPTAVQEICFANDQDIDFVESNSDFAAFIAINNKFSNYHLNTFNPQFYYRLRVFLVVLIVDDNILFMLKQLLYIFLITISSSIILLSLIIFIQYILSLHSLAAICSL